LAQVVPIRVFGNRCLRRPAVEVEAGSARTRELLDTMWATLADDGGVGLAAPQVGESARVVVIRDPGKPQGQQRLDLVNPVVEKTFGKERSFEEGCLSFPGLFFHVVRPRGVQVRYRDYHGEARTLRDDDLVARIVLHEIDHLDGVLFVDRLSRWHRFLLWPRLLLIALGLQGRK
jgi:peptide deformylase